MKSFITLVLLLLSPVLFSQEEWWKSGAENNKKEKKNVEKEDQAASNDKLIVNDSLKEPIVIQPGTIKVVKSSSVNKIIKFKSATISPNMGPVMEGYRVQLFFDQDREAVDKARSMALQIDGETTTYIEYKAPNYLLLLGDFRLQLEAEKVRSELISDFPEAIVVEDKIHLPKIKENETSNGQE